MSVSRNSWFCIFSILFHLMGHFVDASSFLAPEDLESEEGIASARAKLISRLGDVVTGHFSKVVEENAIKAEQFLKTTFMALPKNEFGKVNWASTRFILNRYFVSRHGWSVNGIDPQGEAWNNTLPSAILTGTKAAGTIPIFEGQLDSKGFGVHEVAALAGTVEYLVQEESTALLLKIYRAHGYSVNSTLDDTAVGHLIEDYTMMNIYGGIYVHRSITANVLTTARDKIKSFYRNWPAMQDFIFNIRKQIHIGWATRYYSFKDVLEVLARIADKQGTWQDHECIELKNQLIKLEAGTPGRVPLENFYSAGINGFKQFSENHEYLWMLGALDKNTLPNQRLIIPNYIVAPANCIAGSDYYKLCCMDECESIYKMLEEEIGSHEASPPAIILLVEGLTESSFPTMSPSVLKRLYSIADIHNGMVPLHSRLFAQWIHNVFPRVCKYPHRAGTTNPIPLSMFREISGKPITFTITEMQSYIRDTAKALQSENETNGVALHEPETFAWCPEEEELESPTNYIFGNITRRSAYKCARVVAFLTGLISMLFKFSREIDQGLGVRHRDFLYGKSHAI